MVGELVKQSSNMFDKSIRKLSWWLYRKTHEPSNDDPYYLLELLSPEMLLEKPIRVLYHTKVASLYTTFAALNAACQSKIDGIKQDKVVRVSSQPTEVSLYELMGITPSTRTKTTMRAQLDQFKKVTNDFFVVYDEKEKANESEHYTIRTSKDFRMFLITFIRLLVEVQYRPH